ncbi:Bax inhibitor-1/YccA family protein [Spirosoma aureum]|uniref:Bax inhibitor-1/YccA family protein n=1 Tax=Spirosoma aureum TaxID=2692134 RepID=A0A6G9AU98_9BACT|nr:Bax inhibitor-1/YccA family protein [Spirosoma aureum]
MESQSYPEQHHPSLTAEQIKQEQAAFMTQVYGWMTVALLVTATISIWVASSPAVLELIFGNRLVFYGLLIGEVLLVMYLSAAVQRVSAQMAMAMFLGYAVMNGLTLSCIFLLYTGGSIASTFFVTAGTFGAMSAYGYFTKRDLTSWGGFLMMALIGLIIASVVNLFWQNETLYWIATYAGVLIFVGLTAYDTQKIKEMNIIGNVGTDEDRKEAIMGALRLYLDFINMFLYMLRLFGRRR